MPDRSHHETKRLKAAFSLFPEVNAAKKQIKTNLNSNSTKNLSPRIHTEYPNGECITS
jgi:hypothetical protein